MRISQLFSYFSYVFTIYSILFLNLFVSKSLAVTTVQPGQLDCNNLSPDSVVETTEGSKPATLYCKQLIEETPPPTVNNTPPVGMKPRPPWSMPYKLNGNICRNQGIDTACFTPKAANNLRWNR